MQTSREYIYWWACRKWNISAHLYKQPFADLTLHVAVGIVGRSCFGSAVFLHNRLKLIVFSCATPPPHQLSTQLTSLELQYVSPKLLMCRDLELAVPGTYDPNQAIIRIQSIAPSLQVITSKQRPRKLTIMGKIRRKLHRPCGSKPIILGVCG